MVVLVDGPSRMDQRCDQELKPKEHRLEAYRYFRMKSCVWLVRCIALEFFVLHRVAWKLLCLVTLHFERLSNGIFVQCLAFGCIDAATTLWSAGKATNGADRLGKEPIVHGKGGYLLDAAELSSDTTTLVWTLAAAADAMIVFFEQKHASRGMRAEVCGRSVRTGVCEKPNESVSPMTLEETRVCDSCTTKTPRTYKQHPSLQHSLFSLFVTHPQPKCSLQLRVQQVSSMQQRHSSEWVHPQTQSSQSNAL